MQNRLGPNLTEFMRHFLGAEGEEVRKGDVLPAIKTVGNGFGCSLVRLLMTRMAQLSILYSRIATVAPEPNEGLGRFLSTLPPPGLWNGISTATVPLRGLRRWPVWGR